MPEYRQKGVAFKLLNYLIDLSKERNKKGMVLTCKDHLIHYYKKFGFRHMGVSASCHGGSKWNDMVLEFGGDSMENIIIREEREEGYKGIIIFGEPGYYPKFGFETCDNFEITTPNGENFDAFMGIELVEDAFKDVKGKFYESSVFENLDEKDVEEFDKGFPYMEKLRLPGQWGYSEE